MVRLRPGPVSDEQRVIAYHYVRRASIELRTALDVMPVPCAERKAVALANDALLHALRIVSNSHTSVPPEDESTPHG